MKLSYEINQVYSSWEYETGKTILKTKPFITHIEPTNVCNLECVFCAEGLGKLSRPKGYMNRELFNKIVEENSRNLHHVCLYYHGESLLHPELSYFIKRLKEEGCGVGLTTNGVLLSKIKAKEILEAGVDTLSISFQGISEVYEKEQRGGDFETVLTNIFNLFTLNPKARIYVCILETEATKPYIDHFIEFWKPYDVTVTVGQVESWFGYVKPVYERNKLVCVNPWRSVAVMWNGDVYPSSCDYEGEPYGNLQDNTINELWNSVKFVELRENLLHNQERLRFPCSICNQGGSPPEGLSGFLKSQSAYVSERFKAPTKVRYLELNRCGR